MSTCSGQSQVPMKETVAREAGVVLRGTGHVTQTGVRLHLGLRVGEERPVRVGLGQAGWRWWHWQVKAGETPKLTTSQRESSCMPKLFSSSVRFFFVRATVPSNASQTPDIIRQIIAKPKLPREEKTIPPTADTRLM